MNLKISNIAFVLSLAFMACGSTAPDSPDNPDGPDPEDPTIVGYACFKIQVKDWVIRINDGIL